MEGLIRHIETFSLVLFSGILLIPVGAQGQSHDLSPSSTTPVWVREVAEFGSIETIVKDIDVSQDGEVYVAGGYRFARYGNDGMQRWMREGALGERVSTAYNLYAVSVGDDRIYTMEGPPRTSSHSQIASAGIGIGIYTLEGETIRTILLGDVHHGPGPAWPANILGFGLDAAGNIYAAGIYYNTLFFGPDTLATFVPNTSTEASPSLYDIFLISYTSEGDLRWVQRIGGPGFDTLLLSCNSYDIVHGRTETFAVDDTGNTYIGGCFSGGAVFGEGQLNEVALTDEARVLASFDAQGDLRWAHTVDALGVSGQTHPVYGMSEISPVMRNIAVDAEGNFYVGWLMRESDSYVDYGSVTIGDIVFKNPGGRGAFLTGHAPDGAILWARQMVGVGDSHESISTIVTDASDHVYAGGSFSSSEFRIQGVLLVKSDAVRFDAFVARYDGEGQLRWVEHTPGPYRPDIISMATGPAGDLYIVGLFSNTLRLGLKTITSTGLSSFLAKYDASTITASETTPELPSTTTLTSNYPNPFTHSTTIEYALPASGHVHLSVYDMLGREIAILVDGVQHAGKHVSVFDGTSLTSGTYLYRLEASGLVRTGLMTLMK